ncbi:molybdopterin binding domain [Methanospirillum hungatei JF-1]|jgi:putative molybdopterin biosynthesis protein|uniref:Molybdopterin binding domain n=2 Tax=Methanospirillum hungatei TaxID=2203 RepID=Q2FQZ5_METHJ|nr:molybdopterin binding domain [Methanospirillum hungatei JF-1]
MPRIISPDSLISMKEAQKLILSSFKNQTKSRFIPVKNALGYTLADPVSIFRTIPPVTLAGMDGIALKSKETRGASNEHLREVSGISVNIGLPVPDDYDTIISPEEVRKTEKGQYLISKPISPRQHIIPKGSEAEKGQIIMQADHVLTPYDIAALIHFGVKDVAVRHWKVGMIATGDEIIPSKKEPHPGEIVDTNTIMISGYLQGFGVLTEGFPITPDEPDLIASRILSACDTCDIVLVLGGTSAGTKDYSVDAIEKAGNLLFHGVAMEPGKPVLCGSVMGKPVLGMPGSPAACLLSFFQFVFPLLKSWGVPIPPKKHVIGEITRDIEPFFGYDLFYLVRTRYEDGVIRIFPLEWEFGYITGISADGILHLPEWSNGYRKGERVQISLIR